MGYLDLAGVPRKIEAEYLAVSAHLDGAARVPDSSARFAPHHTIRTESSTQFSAKTL
jgi:hypothetical protein